MKQVKKAQQLVQGEVVTTQVDKAKAFEQSLIKFSDLLIASTSSAHDEINFWEPKTMAPYEPMVDKKFFASANTLCINPVGHIWSSHVNKTTVTCWRWDKKDPVLRFPLKEELSVLKTSTSLSGSFCNGQLLGEIEGAHYMGVNDLDISAQGDLIATAGKDSKVKVWITKDLMTNMQGQNIEKQEDHLMNGGGQENGLMNSVGGGGMGQCYVEFTDHQSEVTQVQFSQNNSNRLFSCSLDKLFKVYDIAARCTLKNIYKKYKCMEKGLSVK